MAACTKEGDTVYLPDPNEPTASAAPLVTVVYDTEGVGDLGYNDLIYTGVERAAAKHGLLTFQLTPSSLSEGQYYLETAIQRMTSATDSIRRLLIVASSAYDDFIRKNSHRLANCPNADLLYLETSKPLDGKGSTLYLSFYGAMYEAGALSPYITDDALIIGANPKNESVVAAVKGFCDGAASNNDSITLTTIYLAQEADKGFNIADSTALMLMDEFFKDYCETMLVPICGGANRTFGNMAELSKTYWYMGIDRQPLNSYFSPMSAVKHIDRAVALCIEQWMSAERMPKHQTFSLASGFTEVVLHPMDSDVMMSLGTLTEEMRKQIHEDAVRKEEAYGK